MKLFKKNKLNLYPIPNYIYNKKLSNLKKK